MALDERRMNDLFDRAVTDFGAAWHTGLLVIGDRLGLYRSLADRGPTGSEELAAATGTHERYVREWLHTQVAGGYVSYEPEGELFFLSEEQAALVVDDESPYNLVGAFVNALSGLQSWERVEGAFRDGGGIAWGDQHECLFHGTERVFRPSYTANLTGSWIPALEGVEETLRRGGSVADVGCGHGAATVLLAQSYPRSTVVGYDFHAPSVAIARQRAREAGVADRVRFEVATAQGFDGGGYDLVTTFDCLHDMGDPVGAAAHIRRALADDGSWLIVEPFAEDRLEENTSPLARAFYGVSTMVCTPCAMDQEVGLALGAQAGEARLRRVIQEGGFSRVRRAHSTPFNLVLEARA